MSESQKPYRVLARKYRPANFSELIGQEALVRTLSNAIESGRIAHAFMLTGVRGVGKTTTARIIAKALNYKGPDGTSGPTVGPTDDCPVCRAITEDRHPDVMEMDAASRTGVDDIREILDGVRYAPTEARYKVYIIDEVHMLSKQAFNALLKTLEEPPEHVKFIFATTEIRKVPVTVLSRCQRFDLRRVDVQTLSAHYKKISEKEGVQADDEALNLIARAADGSVRDGLSLLDQVISLAAETVSVDQVQDMLGLSDRARNLDLLESALRGDIAQALDIMGDLYKSGADPVVVMQDLLGITHVLTKLRSVSGSESVSQTMAPDQIERASKMVETLSMPTLGKTWQILLKGLGEVQIAPNQQMAAEMVIMRLSYAADLPDPLDLLKKLKDGGGASSGGSVSPSPAPSGGGERVSAMASVSSSGGGPAVATAPQNQTETVQAIHCLEDIVAVLEQSGAYILSSQVYQFVSLVKLQEGRLEIALDEEAPSTLPQDIGKQLSAHTGQRWMVTVSTQAVKSRTLAQEREAEKQAEIAQVLQMPIIKNILEVFPEAELVDIQTIKTEQS